MLRVGVLLVAIIMGSLPAAAQLTDWCAAPLTFQMDPGTALLWRLRCTIQILDRERAEAANHVTTAEVEKAVSEAHLKAVADELTKAREELAKVKESAPPEKKKDK
jgi:phage terminase Nu1 subunit (DNA packaging protein)